MSAAVGDFVEGLVGADLFACGGDLVLGAKRRVGLGQDAIVLAELDKFGVGKEGVNLNLVDSRLDLGKAQQLLQTGDGPVGNANGASLSAGQQLLHGAPCRLRVLCEVLLDDVLAVGTNLGLVVGVLLSGDGPVNQEEVDIVEAKVGQRVLHRPLHILGLVEVIPDLGGDEEILSLDRGVLTEEIPHSLADLCFVKVEPGAVEVPVSALEGAGDGLVGLTLCALIGKGAKSQAWDLDTVVEGECGGVGGHGG